MEPLILTASGYTATFLPEYGMNLISFKKDQMEVIDQDTMAGFEERSSGLGALIGPHFHRRKILPKIENEPEFPQSAYCKAHGITDQFSHGVARYVPWKYEKKENGFKGEISGKDLFCGVPLSAIEGQNFKMMMDVELKKEGLKIALSVVSDTDSVVGLHYYYRLPEGKGVVKAHNLIVPLDHVIDTNYRSSPNPLKGEITLDTAEYQLKVVYDCISQENSWQLYHPDNATFVCIEPLSAQDPRHPNLSVSSITAHLSIESLKWDNG